MEIVWTDKDDEYLIRERLLGTSAWSISRVLGCSEDQVWDRINHIIGREKSTSEPEVTPDIDWDNVPSGLNYAWLVFNYRRTGLVWCASRTKPVRTNNGFNGSAVTIWNSGSTDVQVREGVDFRTIFRQRPGGIYE